MGHSGVKWQARVWWIPRGHPSRGITVGPQLSSVAAEGDIIPAVVVGMAVQRRHQLVPPGAAFSQEDMEKSACPGSRSTWMSESLP